MVSGSAAGALKLWSLTEGIELDVQEAAHREGCSAAAFLEPGVVSHAAARASLTKAKTWQKWHLKWG